MDHFEQGLRGDIKSVITWHTFANFQEMYQRAVKIIRVVEENERESQALNLEKRRREINRQGWQGRNDNRPKPNYPLERENNPCLDPPKTQSAKTVVETIQGGVSLHQGTIIVMNVGSGVIKSTNAQS